MVIFKFILWIIPLFALHFCFRIEKSRSVIPKLKKLLQLHSVEDINLAYFYDLLFTRHTGKYEHSDQSSDVAGVSSMQECTNVSEKTVIPTSLFINNSKISISQRKRKPIEGNSNVDNLDGNTMNKKSKASHQYNSEEQDSPTEVVTPTGATTSCCKLPGIPWDGNLKLVHIACHIKLPHHLTCDESACLLSYTSNSTGPLQSMEVPSADHCLEHSK